MRGRIGRRRISRQHLSAEDPTGRHVRQWHAVGIGHPASTEGDRRDKLEAAPADCPFIPLDVRGLVHRVCAEMAWTFRNSWIEGALRHSAKCTRCQHAKEPSCLILGYPRWLSDGLRRPASAPALRSVLDVNTCLPCPSTCRNGSGAKGVELRTKWTGKRVQVLH